MDPIIEQGVALITGAGSGMGQKTSCLLAERGCTKLVLADIAQEGLAATKGLIEKATPNCQVVVQVTDVSNEDSVIQMVDQCVKSFGRLDFAINCAGVARGSVKTTDTTLEDFELLCNVNEKGIFLCEKYEITQMIKQDPLPIPSISEERQVRGAIVNIASMAATAAVGGLAAYTSSKHAVLGIAKVDARQFAPQKIRINCVSPGFVNTPMLGRSGLSQEYLSIMESQSPWNRMTDVVEIAEAAVFLASSRASGITGANMNVDIGANLFHIV